jgi:dihydrofolate reductase
VGKVVAGLTMSLDGFINDRNGSVERLYPDFTALRNTEMLQESMRSTGAVVMGKRAYEMGDRDSYVDNYEYQVPIFVLTHHVPDRLPKQDDKLTFTFVTNGIESAIQKAKAVAGEKDVTVIGGASTIQQCINAGLVDELDVDIMPVLLGAGLRLFDSIRTEAFELERLALMGLPSGRTHLRFRVLPGK